MGDEMAFFPGEKVAEGLDGLRERLAEYFSMGAKFKEKRHANHYFPGSGAYDPNHEFGKT